jgi:hypothetical protein
MARRGAATRGDLIFMSNGRSAYLSDALAATGRPLPSACGLLDQHMLNLRHAGIIAAVRPPSP